MFVKKRELKEMRLQQKFDQMQANKTLGKFMQTNN